MKRGKKYTKIVKDLDRTLSYSLEDGIKTVKGLSYSKFPGTLELHMDIEVPKDREAKSIKGAISLPHSSGENSIRIAVFATPDKEKEAKDAGADMFGLENLIKEVQSGKIDFDIAIATPSVMPKIAILGRELGPRGLMPNPKNGTVSEDIAKAVSEYKKGKQTWACDDSGVIHMNVGKLDMPIEELTDNVHAAVKSIEEVLSKNYAQLITRLHLAPTMGPSVKISYTRE